jgi:hypothetical protein
MLNLFISSITMVNLKNVFIATFAVTFSLRGNDNQAAKLNSKLPSNMKIELYSKYHGLIGLAFLLSYTMPAIMFFNHVYKSDTQF